MTWFCSFPCWRRKTKNGKNQVARLLLFFLFLLVLLSFLLLWISLDEEEERTTKATAMTMTRHRNACVEFRSVGAVQQHTLVTRTWRYSMSTEHMRCRKTRVHMKFDSNRAVICWGFSIHHRQWMRIGSRCCHHESSIIDQMIHCVSAPDWHDTKWFADRWVLPPLSSSRQPSCSTFPWISSRVLIILSVILSLTSLLTAAQFDSGRRKKFNWNEQRKSFVIKVWIDVQDKRREEKKE